MQDEKTSKKTLRTPGAIFSAIMMIAMAIIGSGAITFTASAAVGNMGIELVPSYRDVTYVLDPLEMNQRWDAQGDWNLISTPSITGSALVMGQNQGANLTIEDNSHLDDGMYFEMRVKQSAAGNTSMLLDQFNSDDYVSVGLSAANTFFYQYAATSTATYGAIAGTVNADSYYRIGILFTDAGITFLAYNDTYTAIGSAAVTDANMTYADVDAIQIKQTVAAKAGTVDYVFQSSTHTTYTPATISGTGLNSAPSEEDRFQKMKVDFGDKNGAPGAYSDESFVHTAFNETLANRTLSNDRYLNQTDYAEFIGDHKETKTPVTGVAKYQGWENLMLDNEETLRVYLADQHGISSDQIYLVDYYISDAHVNYSWDAQMRKSVEKAWFSASKTVVSDLGGEVTYDEDAGVLNFGGYATSPMVLEKPADVNYFFFPTAVTEKAFGTSLDTLTDKIREKTVGGVILVPENFANITDLSSTSMSFEGAMDTNVWNCLWKDIDNAYQYTDAMIGQALKGFDFMDIDLSKVQDGLSWSVLGGGKFTQNPLTSATVYGSETVAYGLLILLIVGGASIAVISVGLVKLKKRRA